VSDPILTPEPADPVTMRADATPIDWKPKQLAYEAKRHEHRAAYPHKSIADIAWEEPEPQIAVVYEAPPERCLKCDGKGVVIIEAVDRVFLVTCPACGGTK
jgi:hypothetical protein